MSITYELLIKNINIENRSNLSNVVVQIGWDYIGTNENGITGTCNGRTTLTPDNVDPSTFIPYEQLSEDTVKAWVEASFEDQTSLYYRQYVEQQVLIKINENIKNSQQKESSDLPWAPPVSPTPTP